MGKLRVREGKRFAWSHTAGEWLRGILTQGMWFKTHPPVFTIYTLTLSGSSTSTLVCTTRSSFLHRYRHGNFFTSLLSPRRHLIFWSSTAPAISMFLSFAPSLHVFLLWAICIPFSQRILSFWSRQLLCSHSDILLCVAGQRPWVIK